MIEAAERAEFEAAQKAKTEAAQKEKANKIAKLVARIKEAKKNGWETSWLEEDLYRLTGGKQGRLI
jgi:methylphosphotriester-DNA--protein-cysteine methyltransferase